MYDAIIIKQNRVNFNIKLMFWNLNLQFMIIFKFLFKCGVVE